MQPLTTQVAVVTGGARGVGFGIGSVLAAEGARVVLADVDGDAAAHAASSLRERQLDAVGIRADVTDNASLDELVSDVEGDYGRIDIVAANAGIYPPLTLEQLTDAQLQRVLDINVGGAIRTIRACLPAMLARRYGRIVLTSSITGPITGQVGFAAYGATKAAMLGFMRSAAVELAPNGVTVNAVLPGNVETPGFFDLSEEHQRRMLSAIPLGRLATPEDVGWAVRFLASPEAAYVTGQTLVIDGGQVLPEGA